MTRILLTLATVAALFCMSAGPKDVATTKSDKEDATVTTGVSLADLAKARVQLATEAVRLMRQHLATGTAAPAEMDAWLRRLAEARLELAENKEQRVTILTEWVAAAKDQENRVQKQFAAGITGEIDVFASKYMRLEVELRLAKARAE